MLAVDTGVSCLAGYLWMITCQNLDALQAWKLVIIRAQDILYTPGPWSDSKYSPLESERARC